MGVLHRPLTQDGVINLGVGEGDKGEGFVLQIRRWAGRSSNSLFNSMIVRKHGDRTHLEIRVCFHICVVENILGALGDNFEKHSSFNR